MVCIRKVEIRNFRSIQTLDWFPGSVSNQGYEFIAQRCSEAYSDPCKRLQTAAAHCMLQCFRSASAIDTLADQCGGDR